MFFKQQAIVNAQSIPLKAILHLQKIPTICYEVILVTDSGSIKIQYQFEKVA